MLIVGGCNLHLFAKLGDKKVPYYFGFDLHVFR